MQKLAQINFAKLLGIIIFMILIKEVIPDYLIQDQALKSTYKMAFLGILTVLYVGYTILLFRKKGFSDINNLSLLGVLGFWAFYSWIQYLGIFR